MESHTGCIETVYIFHNTALSRLRAENVTPPSTFSFFCMGVMLQAAKPNPTPPRGAEILYQTRSGIVEEP